MESAFVVHKLIAGVDEVGRGPLAGPVIAAAVILDETKPMSTGMKPRVAPESCIS